MDKATLGFRIYKIWQILKHFAGTFRRAQTLKLGGVVLDLVVIERSSKVNKGTIIKSDDQLHG